MPDEAFTWNGINVKAKKLEINDLRENLLLTFRMRVEASNVTSGSGHVTRGRLPLAVNLDVKDFSPVHCYD